MKAKSYLRGPAATALTLYFLALAAGPALRPAAPQATDSDPPYDRFIPLQALEATPNLPLSLQNVFRRYDFDQASYRVTSAPFVAPRTPPSAYGADVCHTLWGFEHVAAGTFDPVTKTKRLTSVADFKDLGRSDVVLIARVRRRSPGYVIGGDGIGSLIDLEPGTIEILHGSLHENLFTPGSESQQGPLGFFLPGASFTYRGRSYCTATLNVAASEVATGDWILVAGERSFHGRRRDALGPIVVLALFGDPASGSAVVALQDDQYVLLEEVLAALRLTDGAGHP